MMALTAAVGVGEAHFDAAAVASEAMRADRSHVSTGLPASTNFNPR